MPRDGAGHYQIASDAMAAWKDDVLSGTPPTFYKIGGGELSRIEIGPKLLMLLGGAPGSGKSAFVTQAVMDGLRLTPTLRVCMANVEMPLQTILDRQLARFSGVDLNAIRYRQLTKEHADRIDWAMATLEPLTERLVFVKPPFDLENVAETVDAFDADMIVLDYIQRFRLPGTDGENHRGSVNAMMDTLRKFTDTGRAVIVVAAVSRTKDNKGRVSYDGDSLNLASFRESSELEYGADSAYMLCPNKNGTVTLRCLKDRNGEPRDIIMTFERSLQRFVPCGEIQVPAQAQKKVKVPALRLRSMWGDAAQEGLCTTD